MSVFSQRDNTGGKEASFFFFVIGVGRFEDECTVVTGKFAEKHGDDGNDECGNDDDEKDSDDDDDFRFDSDDAVFRDFFLGAILYLPFLTFFGGVTIEVDVLGYLRWACLRWQSIDCFCHVADFVLCGVVFREITR